MRRLIWTFGLLAFVVSALLPPSSEAAKKKDKQVVPVTIVKPSETKFKDARIVKPEQRPAKKKGFLWFKKKNASVEKPKPMKKKKSKLSDEGKAIKKPTDKLLNETAFPNGS